MPATGLRAPARTLVAVRAIVPVDTHAAEGHGRDIGDALGHQLAVGAMPAPAHAVGDHGREQALDRAEERDGHRVRQHGADLGQVEGGSAGAGSERGTSPNREPMVATSR